MWLCCVDERDGLADSLEQSQLLLQEAQRQDADQNGKIAALESHIKVLSTNKEEVSILANTHTHTHTIGGTLFEATWQRCILANTHTHTIGGTLFQANWQVYIPNTHTHTHTHTHSNMVGHSLVLLGNAN